ncbi:MAG: hypothetical protein JNK45_36470, partial [Myxococcales bacterium]|nr:hypothetical protein [Myxococcales bacterium]
MRPRRGEPDSSGNRDGIADSGKTESSSSGPGDSDAGGGVYRCECTEGESEACEIDGVRVCFSIDQEVLTEQVWG